MGRSSPRVAGHNPSLVGFEADQPHGVICRDPCRLVRRSIVHHDDLEALGRVILARERRQAVLEGLRAVVRGHDHGDRGWGSAMTLQNFLQVIHDEARGGNGPVFRLQPLEAREGFQKVLESIPGKTGKHRVPPSPSMRSVLARMIRQGMSRLWHSSWTPPPSVTANSAPARRSRNFR